MSRTADRTPTLISTIIDASATVRDGRSHTELALHALSELGELATEVKIATGCGGRLVAGEDGIVGEAMDLILCVVDFMHILDSDVDDARFIAGLARSLEKSDTNFLKFVIEESLGLHSYHVDVRHHAMLLIAAEAGRLCELGGDLERNVIAEAYTPAAGILSNCLLLIHHETGELVESDLIALSSKRLDKWKAGTMARPSFKQHLTETI